mmetsp:Transcript_28088/g.36471  ORF Transcript_28088/g.36471 Transcript_28088/m.36471 type:complete len:794 (-) Transcript_28088:271-2652(-)
MPDFVKIFLLLAILLLSTANGKLPSDSNNKAPPSPLKSRKANPEAEKSGLQGSSKRSKSSGTSLASGKSSQTTLESKKTPSSRNKTTESAQKASVRSSVPRSKTSSTRKSTSSTSKKQYAPSTSSTRKTAQMPNRSGTHSSQQRSVSKAFEEKRNATQNLEQKKVGKDYSVSVPQSLEIKKTNETHPIHLEGKTEPGNEATPKVTLNVQEEKKQRDDSANSPVPHADSITENEDICITSGTSQATITPAKSPKTEERSDSQPPISQAKVLGSDVESLENSDSQNFQTEEFSDKHSEVSTNLGAEIQSNNSVDKTSNETSKTKVPVRKLDKGASNEQKSSASAGKVKKKSPSATVDLDRDGRPSTPSGDARKKIPPRKPNPEKKATPSSSVERKKRVPRPSLEPVIPSDNANPYSTTSSTRISGTVKPVKKPFLLDDDSDEDVDERPLAQRSKKPRKYTETSRVKRDSEYEWNGPSKADQYADKLYGMGRGKKPLLGGKLSDQWQKMKDHSFAAMRELKGIISSELEAVLLKATRPTDFPVKPKHLEALLYCVRTTPAEYDVYTPILKKLWAKMNEGDWRTTVKASYILHTFAADGMAYHAPLLKSRPKELSRQYNPKYKNNYFNLKQLVIEIPDQGSSYVDFTKRYLEYVLIRTKSFMAHFVELSSLDEAGEWRALGLASTLIDEVQDLVKAGIELLPQSSGKSKLALSCAERVAADIAELFEILGSQIMKELDGCSKDSDSLQEGLQQWMDFYNDTVSQVEEFLKKVSLLVEEEGGEPLFKSNIPVIPPTFL